MNKKYIIAPMLFIALLLSIIVTPIESKATEVITEDLALNISDINSTNGNSGLWKPFANEKNPEHAWITRVGFSKDNVLCSNINTPNTVGFVYNMPLEVTKFKFDFGVDRNFTFNSDSALPEDERGTLHHIHTSEHSSDKTVIDSDDAPLECHATTECKTKSHEHGHEFNYYQCNFDGCAFNPNTTQKKSVHTGYSTYFDDNDTVFALLNCTVTPSGSGDLITGYVLVLSEGTGQEYKCSDTTNCTNKDKKTKTCNGHVSKSLYYKHNVINGIYYLNEAKLQRASLSHDVTLNAKGKISCCDSSDEESDYHYNNNYYYNKLPEKNGTGYLVQAIDFRPVFGADAPEGIFNGNNGYQGSRPTSWAGYYTCTLSKYTTNNVNKLKIEITDNKKDTVTYEVDQVAGAPQSGVFGFAVNSQPNASFKNISVTCKIPMVTVNYNPNDSATPGCTNSLHAHPINDCYHTNTSSIGGTLDNDKRIVTKKVPLYKVENNNLVYNTIGSHSTVTRTDFKTEASTTDKWYLIRGNVDTEVTSSVQFNSSTNPNIPINLYPEWTLQEHYKVIYNSNYPTTVVKDLNSNKYSYTQLSSEQDHLIRGKTYTFADNFTPPTGLKFLYWHRATAPVYNTPWDYTAYTLRHYPKTTFSNLGNNEDVVYLYGTWAPIHYFVRYNLNKPVDWPLDATVNTMSDSKHYYGVVSNLSKNEFVIPGLRFKGWNTKADGTGTHYDDQEKLVNWATKEGAVINLYAQWEPVPYTVVYKAGDGVGSDIKESHIYNVTYDMFNNTPQLTKTFVENSVPHFTKFGYYIPTWEITSIVGNTEPRYDKTGSLGTGTGYLINSTTNLVYPTSSYKEVSNLCLPLSEGVVVTLTARWMPIHYYVEYNNDTTEVSDKGYTYSNNTLHSSNIDYGHSYEFGYDYQLTNVEWSRSNKYGPSLFLGYGLTNGDSSKNPLWYFEGKSPTKYNTGRLTRITANNFAGCETTIGTTYDNYFKWVNEGDAQTFPIYGVWDDCPGIEPIDLEWGGTIDNPLSIVYMDNMYNKDVVSNSEAEYQILSNADISSTIWDREDTQESFHNDKINKYFIEHFKSLSIKDTECYGNTKEVVPTTYELKYTVVDDSGNRYQTSRKIYVGNLYNIMVGGSVMRR